jgi:predicted Zn-dependent protease
METIQQQSRCHHSGVKWLSPPAALAAVLALAAVPAAAPRAQVQLPALGESVSDDITIGAERRLGEQVMRLVRRDADYLDDPLLTDYVASLWAPLVASARRRGEIGQNIDGAFAWESFLVRDRSVNAFALPGGFVGVYLGLISITASRDELASVLAHELSHVTQRHIARSMVNSSRQSMVGLAAMILGMIAAGRSGNPDMALAAMAGGQAALAQGPLNFSRDMEREADRIGWNVYSDAGFAPEGVVSIFEKMDQASRLTDSNAYPYLRSHPLTIERIGEARTRLEGAPRRAGTDAAASGGLEHAVMRARARVLMDTSVNGLRRSLASEAPAGASPSDRLNAWYASALASLMLREPARAQAPLDAALGLVNAGPRDDARARRAVQMLAAQWHLARGEPARAIALLDADADASRPRMLLRAQASLDAARGNAANDDLRRQTEALQTWVSEHRQDALAWGQLAQCAQALGLRLRAVRAEAEARAAIGDVPGAIDRMRAGQRLARSGEATDFIESSVIDSRLRELEALRRQLAAEARGSGREERERE